MRTLTCNEMKALILMAGALLLVAVPLLLVRLDLVAATNLRLVPSLLGIYVAGSIAFLVWSRRKGNRKTKTEEPR